MEGAGKGLAQVEVGENTYIAFATQPGNVTVDGVGENSPFTEAMLQNIEFPGLSISDMMIRVRNATEARTLGNQVPWDQSNLREQFYFTELQVIDPQELGSTLSRILENPSMKEKLMVQLASADGDLQSTVLLLGKQLPDTVRSTGNSSQQKLSGTQVAGLAPSDGLAVVEKDVASALSSLVTGGSDEDDAAKVDISRRVQTELARVGCYRKAIDGDWGPGSKKALSDYFQRTKQARTSLEPDVNLLSDLFLRSGRICRQPVAAPRPVKTATVDRGDAAAKKATAGRKARAQRTRPAAPPPDIGAGIGIGGIF
ncbi:MAG TPA: caspase family protein [Pseudaminobacter sp.]|nr:caspase family protein [Pseudaminobacter sp.]